MSNGDNARPGSDGDDRDADRFEQLVSRHFDGLLSAEESLELGALAAADPARARDFARQSMFHQHLRATLRLEHEYAGRSPNPVGHARGRWPFGGDSVGIAGWAGRFAAIILAATVGAAGVGWLVTSSFSSSLRSIEAGMPGSVSSSPPFAVLNAAVDDVWADSNVGLSLRHGALPRGPIRLVSGRVEMLFNSGGTAVIEGPAVFEPIAANALRLSEGSVRCRCPSKGTELRVVTPATTVTDLGTEFLVTVGSNQQTRLAVTEGSVRIDGGGGTRLVHEGEAFVIDREGWQDDIGFLKDEANVAQLRVVDQEIFERFPELLADPDMHGVGSGSLPEMGQRASLDLRATTWMASGSSDGIVRVEPVGGSGVRIHSRGSVYWPFVAQEVVTGEIGGQLVLFEAVAAQPANDSLSGRQCAIVKLEFIDANRRMIGDAQRHFLRAGTPVNRYVPGMIAAEAPAGTVAVRAFVLLNAFGGKTGSIIVERASLVVASER
jgi:anti-sigma factor RsiW